MFGLLGKRAHAFEFAIGRREVELVGGHGFYQRGDFAVSVPELTVQNLPYRGRIGRPRGRATKCDPEQTRGCSNHPFGIPCGAASETAPRWALTCSHGSGSSSLHFVRALGRRSICQPIKAAPPG